MQKEISYIRLKKRTRRGCRKTNVHYNLMIYGSQMIHRIYTFYVLRIFTDFELNIFGKLYTFSRIVDLIVQERYFQFYVTFERI